MLLLYAAVGLFVAFMALTRTQVGRDGLRVQLERQFNEHFAGEMQIGRLQGNLLNTLYVDDIRFLDSTGILVASVDGAVLEPSWLDLFSRTLSFSRITLIEPELHMIRREDGSWNVAGVFRRRTGGGPADPLAFTSSEIRIMDGVVRTSREGALPERIRQGTIFNFTEATATRIQTQLNVEWRPELKLLDVDRLSLELEDLPLRVEDVHGQFVWRGDRIELNEVYVEAGAMRLHLAGSLDHMDQWEQAPGEVGLDLDVRESRIDHDLLRRLFPAYPLADTMQVTSRIQGPLDALRVDRMHLARGDLTVEMSGVVRGFPDSLAAVATLSSSVLSLGDLSTLVPAAGVPLGQVAGSVNVRRLDVRGMVPLGPDGFREPLYGEALFEIDSPAGALQGNLEIVRAWKDSAATFQGKINMDSLRLEALVPQYGLSSRLNGTLALEGAGNRFDDLVADMKLGLKASALQGRAVDTLDVYLYAHHRVLAFDALAVHAAAGAIRSDGILRLDGDRPALEADVEFARLDAGRLLYHDSLATRLNGLFQINVRGSDLASLRGRIRLAMDSSRIQTGRASGILPPHTAVFALMDLPDGRQELRFEGDPLFFSAKAHWQPDRMAALGRRWRAALHNAVRDIIEKPHGRALPAAYAAVPGDSSQAGAYPTPAFLTLDDRREDLATTDEPLAIELDFSLRQLDLLHPWLPVLRDATLRAGGAFDVHISRDRLALNGELRSDTLRLGMARLDGLSAGLDLEADRTRPPSRMFRVETDIIADTLALASLVIPSPEIAFTLDEASGALTIHTKSNRRMGPQRMIARIGLLPDRNRVVLEDLLLSIGNSAWTSEAPAYLDLFGRTIVIPGITLQSRSTEADILQRVALSGVLSPLPGDTAAIVIDNIALRPVSQFLDMNSPLGGLLSGHLALTTSNSQPELTGSIHVDRFALDDRVLGNVDLASRYIPGEPDVGLRIEISPVPPADRDALLPDAATPASYTENALVLDGTFRLPRFNRQATGFIDAGALDLDLSMTRADVFFFELIFPNFLERTTGYLTGNGVIGGDFTYPVFDADLRLVDGAVSIPKFNLLYTDFEGPVLVNREGIYLTNATFRDPTGGRATVSGGFLFNDYRYFSFDLQARLEELLIMNQDHSDELPFYGQIWASGTLTLTGPTYAAMLRSEDAVTRANSELFIPVTEEEIDTDVGFLIFADSTGQVPDLSRLAYRRNLLSERPRGERKFIDGLSMDLNIFAPPGSTIHLVFDPLLGDVVNAVSSGRIQIQKKEGEFSAFGTLFVESGDYLFTAGDVFARKFLIDRGGTITWDGDPINAALSIPASYRTRASTAGLPGNLFDENAQIPLIVSLDISGRVSSPQVELSLRTDRSDRNYRGNYEGIEAILNQTERIQEYATSVLLTNSFVLTTASAPDAGTLTDSGNQLAFSSVSQLVASQLNRFLNEALPNVELNLGLQGESLEDPELTYGVALYLLDERIVLRGEGIYQNDLQQNEPGLEGEFEVEIRLSPSVSVSVFLRREGDVLAENALTSTRGAGLSYQTQFPSWRRFVDRLFGWMRKKKEPPPPEQVAQRPDE